jgi:predicted transcriptional regulator
MTTATFSMRIDTKTKRALEEEARRQDRSAAYVAQRAIAEYLEREEAKVETVRKTLAEPDDGIRYSEEIVSRWMARWADGHDDPFPEPDINPNRQ